MQQLGTDAATAGQPVKRKRPHLKFLGYMPQGYTLTPQNGSQKRTMYVLKLFQETGKGENITADEVTPGS